MNWSHRIHGWYLKPNDASIAVTFSVATALIGVFLGVSADLAKDASVEGTKLTTYFYTALPAGLLGLGSLILGYKLWRNAAAQRTGRGTAYVIDELGDGWTPSDKAEFEQTVALEFSNVLQVPSPLAGRDRWTWQLDETGAAQWDSKVNELVRNFEIVRHNDDQITANGVFITAPWPIGVALGVRVPATRRGLTLNVYQRPSDGQGARVAGYIRSPRLKRPRLPDPIDFLAPAGRADPTSACPYRLREKRFHVNLQVSGCPPQPAAGPTSVTIVVVRPVLGWFGSVPPNTEMATLPDQQTLVVHNWSTLSIASGECNAIELSLTKDGQSLNSGTKLEFPDFPAIVESIVTWFTAAKLGGTVILATTMPQEIGFGIGMRWYKSANNSRPGALLPALFERPRQTGDAGHFVIPNLNLGSNTR